VISRHAILGLDIPLPYTRTFQLRGRPVTRDRFSFRTDSDTGQFAAIRAGCGIGVCHGPLAQRERLVPILPKSQGLTVLCEGLSGGGRMSIDLRRP
jgi:DNA-binding transcriptional LysR family regulator